MDKIYVLFVIMLHLLSGSNCMREEKASSGKNLADEEMWREQRRIMVDQQIRARGVQDTAVLAAMESVPRHLFVPAGERHLAYGDHPLPIGYDQTISQPYIVAYMTAMLEILPEDKVLEIGTGSGYQAAVLSMLAREVYTIEIVEPLCLAAADLLPRLGVHNVQVRCGDGYAGWPEQAPFNAIMITASPETVPQPLVDQLAPGGRMILPLGSYYQELVLITRDDRGHIARKNLIPVRFVPMTGKVEKK